jgi:hypothetical protein
MIEEKLHDDLSKKFDPSYWSGWKAFKHYKHTGVNLVEEVNALDPDLVIDVGCGHNRFKGHIKNLIGFDQAPFPFSDIISNIDDINFRTESADVVMALGSIQFGSKEIVLRQMDKLISWVKPGGYIVMRTMKDWFRNEDYPFSESHYIWEHSDIDEVTEKYNLKIIKGVYTEEIVNPRGKTLSTRLAWWWQKPGQRVKNNIDLLTCDLTERE